MFICPQVSSDETRVFEKCELFVVNFRQAQTQPVSVLSFLLQEALQYNPAHKYTASKIPCLHHLLMRLQEIPGYPLQIPGSKAGKYQETANHSLQACLHRAILHQA